MRKLAVVVGLLAAVLLGAAGWLLFVTVGVYTGETYAPNASAMTRYAVKGVEADGSGIFVPVLLLAAFGVFLARFALNLWRR